MRIVSVKTEHFRCAEAVSLDNCSQYNVLIGRNNAGKSTLLMALDAFAVTLRSPRTSLLGLEASIGESIDYYGKKINRPILVTVSFALLASERASLLSSIRTCVPQLASAVDAFAPDQYLVAQVGVLHKPKISWLRELYLRPTATEAGNVLLLRCDEQAASEMWQRHLSARLASTTASDLDELGRRIDADDFLQAKQTQDPRRPIFMYLSRRKPVDDRTVSEFSSLIEASSSYQEFKERAATRVAEISGQVETQSGQPYKASIETFAGPMNAIPEYILVAKQLVASLKVLYMRERRAEIGATEASRILNLKTRRGGSQKLAVIQETVESLLGVSIDAFAEGNNPQKGAELDVDEFLVDVNGAGIREALRIVLDYEFERPAVLIVEEPEMHLHPALEASVARFLARISNDCQIFIATHSTRFLDSSTTSSVFLVTKHRGQGTLVQQLSSLEHMVQHVPAELGIRLSSLFMYDRLVFVEGPNDEDVIREWAERQSVNLGLRGVGFVPIGGVGNLRYFAAEDTLSFLSRRQVGMWFVIDRDERSDSAVSQIEARLKGRARSIVLGRRQMENYFLQEEAIIKLIADKRKDSMDASPTTGDIRAKLSVAIDAAQSQVIERRVKRQLLTPMHFAKGIDQEDIVERVRARISAARAELEERDKLVEETVKTTTKAVQQEWETRKFELVDGAAVIDDVLRAFNLRFHKERDSTKLARYVEVPMEFTQMFREIEADEGNGPIH